MAEFDGEPAGPLGGGDATGEYADLITEARERFQLCLDSEDRSEALDDLRFLKGEQWDAEAVNQRELDNRPCLTFNNIPAIINQVTNDARQNKQSIQVAPVDDGADVKVAEVIEGLIRHIEYDSGADAAYDTALDGAARIGFGFFRLVTEYESPTSFNQDIKIKRIRNPFTVHIDPNIQEADGSDAQFAFISSRMPMDAFKRSYPKASATGEGVGTATGDGAVWASKDWVRIAEYYRVEHTPDELLMLADGSTVFADTPEGKAALAAGGQAGAIVDRRPSARRIVMWYKITGAEVLEKAEIACDTIPVFPVYGEEIDEDGKVTRNGIIRNAKSPKKMENYWLTSATEEIAMRTKTPFVGALGQFEGVENDWNQANVRNFSYLEYNPVSIDGNLAPPPQRQAPADVPTGFIAMAGIARDTVKAVTGIYDASLGNRSNETSGIAISARQRQGEVANFHFTDNLTRAIVRMAKCLIQMIPRIYDTQRVVRILGQDRKSVEHVAINKPGMKDDGQGNAIAAILNDLTVGKYDVTVSTGPAYNTLRQEAAANMLELGGKWPDLMTKAGDLVVKAMDFPGAQEMAERLAPPGVGGDDDQEGMVQTPGGPIPVAEAGQLIGQMNQAMEAMQAELEKLESGQAKTEADNATKVRVAEINADARMDVEELKGSITLLTNQMAPILAHLAAVQAAADPAHPSAPAPIAQGMAPSPAAVAMAEPANPEPPAGETAGADGAA